MVAGFSSWRMDFQGGRERETTKEAVSITQEGEEGRAWTGVVMVIVMGWMPQSWSIWDAETATLPGEEAEPWLQVLEGRWACRRMAEARAEVLY